MQEVVDLPDRHLDLFIRLCLQNHGRLSQAKRESTFRALRDDEIERLEQCVMDGYGSTGVAGARTSDRPRLHPTRSAHR